MWRALRSNPLTAPYAINPTWKNGVVILSGRVGTKQVHDAAVQMAIAFGFPFRDDLVIDTAETFRAAMSSTPSMTGYGALAPNLSASYYVYPQPLFGWLDDPFFGMEPPVVSFAPWTRNRLYVPIGGHNGARSDGDEPRGRARCRPRPRASRIRRPPGPGEHGGPDGPVAGNPPGADPWGSRQSAGGQPVRCSGARARRRHGTAPGKGGHRDHG